MNYSEGLVIVKQSDGFFLYIQRHPRNSEEIGQIYALHYTIAGLDCTRTPRSHIVKTQQ